MTDDRFDETLAALAREHNRAPEVPRDEMWAAIAAARATDRVDRAVPAPVVIPMRKPPVVYWRWAGVGGALAATLLIGIVIGRMETSRGDTTPSSAAVASSAAAPSGTAEPAPATSATTSIDSEPAEQSSVGSRKPVARPDRATVRPASAPRGAPASGGRSRAERDPTLPYRVATMQHLVTTEALLVSLRTDVRAGRRDTTIAGWAGDLLGTTRMLMDSPASDDPQLKRLLEDLELVLAQIARLPGARGEAADLSLIDDAVQRRQIMTRLRAITPGT